MKTNDYESRIAFNNSHETQGVVIPPLATAAALDSSAFGKVNATDVIPAACVHFH